MKSLFIIHVTSEVYPYTKTGGLADVARSLPRALKDLGHEIAIFTPYYAKLDYSQHNLEEIITDLKIPLPDGGTIRASVLRGWLQEDLPVYLIAQSDYFGRRRGIYGDPQDNQRFYIFNVAVLEAIKRLKLNPDVLHCHDWHAGFLPYLLRNGFRKLYPDLRTVFTIHNLSFQFGHNWWEVPTELKDNGRSSLPQWSDVATWERLNFAKRAIMTADAITTVSEQYVEEILTKDFGNDLHRILINRRDHLFGVINGLDYKDYNPATDPGLIANYTADNIEGKTENKRYLQKLYGLRESPNIPVIGMVSRLTEQKGFDLLLEIIDPLLRMDVQLVTFGGGSQEYVQAIKRATKRFPTKCAAHLEFDVIRATQHYAGSDMFLMPSRFEPCGLGQLISLRYGSVPIVRATGGLVDTIVDYNSITGRGNGFVFHTYDSRDMLVAITRAITNFKYQDNWRKLMETGMRQSFTWQIPAKKYLTIYRRLLS